MHILYLADWYPEPLDNGSKLRIFYFLKALAKQHTVTFVGFAHGTAEEASLHTIKPFTEDAFSVQANPYHHHKLFYRLRFFILQPVANIPITPMSKLIAKLMRHNQFDAIVCTNSPMAEYARQFDLPVILEEHNSTFLLAWERYTRSEKLLKKLQAKLSWHKRRRYDRKLYADMNKVVMVSERDQVGTLPVIDDPKKLMVVPNGVDCDQNRPNLTPKRPNNLIYNGAMTYSVNFDAVQYFLSDIFRHIQNAIPQTTFTVTGSLKNVPTDQLNLNEAVELTGFVDDIRLPVAAATICVVPLRFGGGSRLKILEAMALGTPVVSTSKGAEGLNVEDGVHLLIADDPTDFAAKVVTLLGDEELQHTLAANARQLVEAHYDWSIIGRKFTQIVESVV